MLAARLSLVALAPPRMLSTQDDESLARQAGQDPDAFATLYSRYLDRVYRFVVVRTGSVQDAQDLTSQTFLAALEHIASFRSQGSFGGWLFGIARHKIIDHYRQQRGDAPLEVADELADPVPEPEQVIDQRLQVSRVSHVLASLDPQQAEAIALRIFGQLSAAEAGQVMGKSAAAVRMLVHRGLRTLRERLDMSQEAI